MSETGTEQTAEGEAAPSAPDPLAELMRALRGLANPVSARFARLASVDLFMFGLLLIVVVQGAWLAILMHAGWYYQADFDNLATATGSSLSWSYLSSSQGGHLDIIGKLVLWLLNRTVPLNYDATIALRVVASALVTYLLGRLLRELVGARRGVLALVLLFAVSPLLVQSTLFLTSSINFLLSELLVLAALRAYIRYAVTDLLGWALFTGIAMLGATLVAEQAAVTALALPIMTFAFLSQGTVRERLRAIWHAWPAWLMIGVPIVAFATFYFASGKYATKSSGFGISDALQLVARFWFDTLIPGIFGGPFAWSTVNGNYFAFSAAPLGVRIIAVLLLAAAVSWTVRRTSIRALWGWSIPLLISGIGLVFVGRARVELYGSVAVARRFEYASYAAIPAAVGLALAIWSTSAESVRSRVADGETPVEHGAPSPGHAAPRLWTARAVVVVLGLLSAVSAGTYAHAWAQSPSKAYVARLSAGLKEQGADATVFDTYVAGDVMPGIQGHRNVSDLLSLMGAHAYINNGPVPTRVVSAHGDLVPASFLTTAAVPIKHSSRFCNDLFFQQTSKTQRFNKSAHPSEWFVRLTYFQQHPTILNIHMVTARGRVIAPFGGSQVLLQPKLGVEYLQFPQAIPAAVEIQGATPATNVCVTAIAVGYPFPAAK